ncbi:hypothetical protein SS50377_21862 [Spironucleus salmonicida]|uniref:Uncharacterized protein n=1 Tax=Spironucleus salmonicida TaxID=348837 RepID=V6LKZ1_9EUKA|nr:hypothetical protein SS50377_21862 [Spironucleus salmonicida]|eukprot:EST44406.1 Hypothetical protein SS50377_15711 [Spironucleus salmonicida]
MQETSKIAWATLQDVKHHFQDAQPDFILKITTLEQCLRKLYEFFLESQPSEAPLLQKALDSALQRTISLEQRVLEAERISQSSSEQINSERQKNTNYINQIQNLKSKTIPQLEEICSQNANSARQWKQKCAELEAQIINLNTNQNGKLNSIYTEMKRFQQIINEQKSQIEMKNQNLIDLQKSVQNGEKRLIKAVNETQNASSSIIQKLQFEIATLQSQMHSMGQQAIQRQNDENQRILEAQIASKLIESGKDNQMLFPQKIMMGNAQNGENSKQSTGIASQHSQNISNPAKSSQLNASLTQLESSNQPDISTSFIDEINVAMRKMRSEQVFMQQQPIQRGSAVVDLGLQRINERLRKLGGKTVFEESEF